MEHILRSTEYASSTPYGAVSSDSGILIRLACTAELRAEYVQVYVRSTSSTHWQIHTRTSTPYVRSCRLYSYYTTVPGACQSVHCLLAHRPPSIGQGNMTGEDWWSSAPHGG